MKLDETSLRRPDFAGGTPVRLADGRDWTLPRPRVRFVPDDGPTGFATCLALAGADDYQALLDAAAAAEAGPDVIRTELALGRRLLLANYDLTPGQVADLLQFGYDEAADPEAAALREAVTGVAFGRGPKPSAAGGA